MTYNTNTTDITITVMHTCKNEPQKTRVVDVSKILHVLYWVSCNCARGHKTDTDVQSKV